MNFISTWIVENKAYQILTTEVKDKDEALALARAYLGSAKPIFLLCHEATVQSLARLAKDLAHESKATEDLHTYDRRLRRSIVTPGSRRDLTRITIVL